MILVTLNLQTDAIAEAQRLTAARGWVRSGDEDLLIRATAEAPIVARARSRGTRRQLAGRMLLIFRVSSLDRSGRVAESQIAGALVPFQECDGPRRRSRICGAVRAAEHVARTHIDAFFAAHHEAASAVSRRFIDVRAARHRAIAARAGRGTMAPFQGGLFDRRAQRARDAATVHTLDRERRLNDRVRASEDAAIVSQAVDLVLVLTP